MSPTNDRDQPPTAQEPVDVNLLRELLDALPVKVAYVDAGLVSRYRNRAMRDWIGVAPSDDDAVPVQDLLSDNEYAAIRRYIEGAADGVPQAFERTLRSVSGQPRRGETRYLPRQGKDGPDGFFVVVTDTERRAAGEAKRAEALIRSAILEERARMAIAMHDELLQRLFAIGLDLDLLPDLPPEAQARVRAAEQTLRSCTDVLRRTIKELSRGGGPASPLRAAGELVANSKQQMSVEPSLEHEGSFDSLPEPVTEQLLTVLAEALDNVVCHANATELAVTLVADSEEVVLTVADNGVGLEPPTVADPGILAALGEQTARLGGSLMAHDNPPGGTVLTWRMPLDPG